MTLLQRRTTCTVHDGEGGRCGIVDQCTHVVTEAADGRILHEHDVCRKHRIQMRLPEWDVTISAGGEMRRFEAQQPE